MKIIDAFKKYSSLDDRQKDFIKNRKRLFQNRPDELLKFMSPMAAFDKDCDAARRQCGWGMGLAVVVGIFFAVLQANLILIPVVNSALITISVVVFLIFAFLYVFLKNIDIHNNLRDFVVPIINTISLDMPENGKIKLKLDLRGGQHNDKKLRCDAPSGWFAPYPRITSTYYKDPWLELSAELFDGSRLLVSVVDMITHKSIKKKNRRGKIKFKSKLKIKHRIRASLALKNKKYELESQTRLAESGDRIKQKEGARRNTIGLTRIETTSRADESVDSTAVLAMIGKILMSVKPAS